MVVEGCRSLFEEGCILVLKDVKEVLDKHNVVFWLEDGALLGAIREGGMIKWDDDVDLGAFQKDFQDRETIELISKDLKKKGFSSYFFKGYAHFFRGGFNVDLIYPILDQERKISILPRIRHGGNVSRFLTKIRKLGTLHYSEKFNFDASEGIRNVFKRAFLRLVYLLPSGIRKNTHKMLKFVIHPLVRAEYYLLKMPISYFETFVNFKFHGVDIRIPELSEEYLTAKYGNWRIPLKRHEEWNWWEHGGWEKATTQDLANPLLKNAFH